MKVYTSYFGNMRNLEKEGIMVISIARYSPKWYYGTTYTVVSPTSYMLSSSCSHEEYVMKYNEILSKLNPNYIMNAIRTMSKGRDVALLCYEKPSDFCHRHMLADWLNKHGYDVSEWQPKEKEEQAVQLSLFE